MGHQHEHVLRSCIVTALVVAAAAACGEKEPPKTPSGELQTQGAQVTSATFTFAPPAGTKFMRTERRRYDASIVGTPLARRDEQELRWSVDIERSGDQYAISQQLVHLVMRHNDQTLVDAEVPSGAIVAQLLIDRSGNLVDVRGLEQTSATLQALAGPGMDADQQQALSPQSLKRWVAMRYNVLVGDAIGRSARPGSTWTGPGRPGTMVKSRTVTVERTEPCGGAVCARMREQMELDPLTMFDTADNMVKGYVQSAGGDPNMVHAQSASYQMSGTLLTEPSTMLNHEASLAENGRVTVAGPSQNFDVVLKGTMEFTYDYAPQHVAQVE